MNIKKLTNWNSSDHTLPERDKDIPVFNRSQLCLPLGVNLIDCLAILKVVLAAYA
ncbi:hypothetical protein MU448_07765 [Streptococcus sp. O1]|nr:hypothetical protein [Streptococcus sp. O1]